MLDGSLRFAFAASGLGVGAWGLLGLGMAAAVFVFDSNAHGEEVFREDDGGRW